MLLLLTPAFADECDAIGVSPEWVAPADADTGVVVDHTVTVGFRGLTGDLNDWDVRVEVAGVAVDAAVATACWLEPGDLPQACIFVVDPTADLPPDTEITVIAAEAGVDAWTATFTTGVDRAAPITEGVTLTLGAEASAEVPCAGEMETRDLTVSGEAPAYVLLRAGLSASSPPVGLLSGAGDTTVLVNVAYQGCFMADPVSASGEHGAPAIVCPPGVLNEGCDIGVNCLVSNCCSTANAAGLLLVFSAFGGWSRVRRTHAQRQARHSRTA